MKPLNRLRGFGINATRRSSPITQNVSPENISTTRSGELYVELGRDWPSMWEDLRAVGSVLSISRNTHAVIGREGWVPQLDFSSDLAIAGDHAGEFDFEFGYWHRARAVHSRTETGNIYSVEWLDAFGNVHHKTCLTTEASLAHFSNWVALYQNFESASPFADKAAARPAGRVSEAVGTSTLVHRGCVEYLIREAISEARSLRFVVGNDATVQGHRLIPIRLQYSGDWCFLNGDRVGIHLRTKNLAEVVLVQSLSAEGPFYSLKLYEPEGRLITVISAPLDAERMSWNQFLTERIVLTNSPQSLPIESYE